MKKIMLSAFLAFAAASTYAQAPAPQAKESNANAPRFSFAGGSTHDFGNVQEGGPAEYAFEFKNTGKSPLIIQSANASCGCTTPDWPKEPILPGKKGKITVRYNTQGRPGPIDKTVWITSNAAVEGSDRYELHIKGNVVPAQHAETLPKQ